MNPVISVFVMAYDEAGNLEITARELLEALNETGKSYELVIINDGSRDGTPISCGDQRIGART